jgi:hypothetical protein
VIPTDVETPVHVSASIPQPTVIPSSVTLLLRSSTGTTVLAYLQPKGDGTYIGEANLRARGAPITLAVSAAFRGVLQRVVADVPPIVSVRLPSTGPFTVNTTALSSAGDSLSFDTFSGQYEHGGLIPTNGATINIRSISLPTNIAEYINSTEVTDSSVIASATTTLSGVACTDVSFNDDLGKPYFTRALFCPSGDRLYKFYLTYIDGDPKANIYKSYFETIIGSAVLPH